MVGGSTADEEFVELFNPTSADIDLAALPLKLHIINSTGATDTNKTLHFTQSIIKAHGYFLIASSVYQAKYNDEITAVGVGANGVPILLGDIAKMRLAARQSRKGIQPRKK